MFILCVMQSCVAVCRNALYRLAGEPSCWLVPRSLSLALSDSCIIPHAFCCFGGAKSAPSSSVGVHLSDRPRAVLL